MFAWSIFTADLFYARARNLRWGAPDEGVRGYISNGRMFGENRVSD
jgi:hypothetical protein